MADLKPAEVEKAKQHFDIYDFEGNGKVDLFHLGDLVRSLDIRPTNGCITKAGATKKKGEKYISLEEFLPIYSQVKKDKDVGAYEDLLEGLKVYDKMENSTMMAAELGHTLVMLGERLTDLETEDIMKACIVSENEDGYFNYDEFLKKLLGGPYPLVAK